MTKKITRTEVVALIKKLVETVASDSGWETTELCEGEGDELIGSCVEETLKSEEANALLSYLFNLNIK